MFSNLVFPTQCTMSMKTRFLTGMLLFASTQPVAAGEMASAGEVAERLDTFDSYSHRMVLSASIVRTGLQGVSRNGAPRLAPWYQRNYTTTWEASTPYGRRVIAESIGEQGRARLASEAGWEKRLGSQNRGIPQGPDAGYFDHTEGKYRAIESKGGTSQPKISYGGALQGTNRYMVRAARRAFKSANTGFAEKVQQAEIIVAGERGILNSAVVRTPHGFGAPRSAFVDGAWDSMDVSREASKIRRTLERMPEGREAFSKADRNMSRFIWRWRLPRISLAAFSAFGAVFSGISAKEELGRIDPNALLNSDAGAWLHGGLALGRGTSALTMTGMTAGELAELGCFGRGAWAVGGKTAGRMAGKAFLPVAVAVEGLAFGVAYYEYSTGQISHRDLYRRSTGPAAFAVCTGGGALLGSVIPGAGTLAGAGVGGLVAIPAGYAADWAVEKWYAKADAAQQGRVDACVMEYYGNKETHP